MRTSNKVVLSKMLLHRRLLKGHGLYSSCYEVLIFLLLVSSDHKYLLQSTAVCMSPNWNWDPSIPSAARYPFISITHSKPLMSSGSWLTPVTTDIILKFFFRVSIYPWPRKGGLQLISKPNYFIRVTIYPAALPYYISRGHYLPCKVYCHVLDSIKFIIHMRPLSFCLAIANITELCKFTDFFSQ